MTSARGIFRNVGPSAAAVLLAIVALLLHPHTSGHGTALVEFREIHALSLRDRLVHGTLLFLIGVLLIAFASYSVRRGLTRRLVVAGLVLFTIGIGSLFAAGLIDGFVLPEIVARFVTASARAQDAALATLVACSAAVDVSTAFGIIAMALAIIAWSLDLAAEVGRSRTTGMVGIVTASLSLLVLIMGGASLTPHTLIAVLFLQGVWYVCIAVYSVRESEIPVG